MAVIGNRSHWLQLFVIKVNQDWKTISTLYTICWGKLSWVYVFWAQRGRGKNEEAFGKLFYHTTHFGSLGSKQLTHFTTVQQTWPCSGFENPIKVKLKKIKLAWASRWTQPKIKEKHHRTVNVVGIMLTILHTECQMGYKIWLLVPFDVEKVF